MVVGGLKLVDLDGDVLIDRQGLHRMTLTEMATSSKWWSDPSVVDLYGISHKLFGSVATRLCPTGFPDLIRDEGCSMNK